MALLAHSHRGGQKEQEYSVHITGMWNHILQALEEMKSFLSAALYDKVWRRMFLAAVFHDIGKLSEKNQKVLHQRNGNARKLPEPHQYAGAYLLYEEYKDIFAAALVYGHHKPGLPNLIEEFVRDDCFFPGNVHASLKDAQLQARIQKGLPCFLKLHEEEVPDLIPDKRACGKPTSLEERISLSMLVDADWSDTAGRSYKKVPVRWSERLAQLDSKREKLLKSEDSFGMRDFMTDFAAEMFDSDFYDFCRGKSDTIAGFQYYDSIRWESNILAPFVHLLRCAERHKLRHIVMVMPQEELLHFAEDILNEFVVLPNEKKEDVVAVTYHQIDFSVFELRELGTSWEAPIILTTANAFFETLSANTPSKLRKLHQLPGSAVFIGGFSEMFTHVSLPLIWRWITELTKQWGCYTLLASDATIEFYEFEDFMEDFNQNVTEEWPRQLFPDEDDVKWEVEQKKCSLHMTKEEFSECWFDKMDSFLDFVLQKSGPRIIVTDEPLISARIAYRLKQRKEVAYYLSDGLTVENKGRILNKLEGEILKGFKDKGNREWTLVTTDFTGLSLRLSFRSGFIRASSYADVIRCLKTINRKEEYSTGDLWAFELDDPIASRNKMLDLDLEILYEIIDEGIEGKQINECSLSELSTYAFREFGKRKLERTKNLLELDECGDFKTIAHEFSAMYNKKYYIGITDESVINQVRYGRKRLDNEMQKKIVPLNKELVDDLELKEIHGCPGIYYLPGEKYDAEFLGCYKTLI